MSREAPPDSPPDPKVAPTEEHHAILWMALPLVALGLPFAYRLAVSGSMSDALRINFVLNDLELAWFAASLTSALTLLGFMAARRRGRTVWPAMDVIVGAFPWVIALAAQSMRGGNNSVLARSMASYDVEPWGLVPSTEVLVTALTMCEERGIGALMTAALWASAAVSFFLPHADAPRWRGASLVVVTLPAWGVAYGFGSSGSLLPFIGAAWLSGLVLFAGTQTSPAARSAGQTSVLLGALVVIALNVSAACEALVALPAFDAPSYFAVHARLYDTLRALKLSGFLLFLPAVLARVWLARSDDPPAESSGSRALLAVAVVSILVLDHAGTGLALSRVTPAEWPPWAGLDVEPMLLSDSASGASRRSATPRYILAAGELRNARGEQVARLSDAAAIQAELAQAPMARLDPRLGDEWGERLAIMPQLDQAPEPVPICHGRTLSVLLDRTLPMADLRAFVAAAVVSNVVELDVVGPAVFTTDAKHALLEALRAAGQEGAWPTDPADERAYLQAARALPATGFAAADLSAQPATFHLALLPTPCWMTQLAGAPPTAPASPLGSQPGGAVQAGEVLNEMPANYVEPLPPGPPRALWLDPARDVQEFLLGATRERPNAAVIWTLEAPAP